MFPLDLQSVQAFSTVVLVIITAIYVWHTKKILEVSKTATKLTTYPELGVQITGITPPGGGRVYRESFISHLSITNLGNAPAIDVFIDAEVTFPGYSHLKNSVIHARDLPTTVPFIRQGETIEHGLLRKRFDETCVRAIITPNNVLP